MEHPESQTTNTEHILDTSEVREMEDAQCSIRSMLKNLLTIRVHLIKPWALRTSSL